MPTPRPRYFNAIAVCAPIGQNKLIGSIQIAPVQLDRRDHLVPAAEAASVLAVSVRDTGSA
jgi:hypothetical protein